MHLIYVDESGNSGKHLNDPQQPIFVLAALIVPEDNWTAIEQSLEESVQQIFKGTIPPDQEIHATDLRNGSGIFRGVAIQQRMELRDEWLKIAAKHKLPFIYRAIVKKRFATWLTQEFPAGVAIDPHVVAFPLIAQSVNECLRQMPGSPRGIFISDEKKEIIADVEKTIRLLRGDPGQLRLSQIIEKGFFADSQKSRHIQLCDLCAYYARKKEEVKEGLDAKPLDSQGIQLIEPLIHRGRESLPDVLRWFVEKNQPPQKKERPRENPGSVKGPATLVAKKKLPQSKVFGKPTS